MNFWRRFDLYSKYMWVIINEYINSCMVGLDYRVYRAATLIMSGVLGYLTAETRHDYGMGFSFGLMLVTTLIWCVLIELGKYWLFGPRKERHFTVVQDYSEG